MALDEAIVSYVRKKYGVIIGQLTAEQLKISIGAAVPQDEEQTHGSAGAGSGQRPAAPGHPDHR